MKVSYGSLFIYCGSSHKTRPFERLRGLPLPAPFRSGLSTRTKRKEPIMSGKKFFQIDPENY